MDYYTHVQKDVHVLSEVTKFLQIHVFPLGDKSLPMKDRFPFLFERHLQWSLKIYGYHGLTAVISSGVFLSMKTLSLLCYKKDIQTRY